MVEGFLFFLYERSRNKKLLSTSKTSFWLGFGRATSAGVCQRVARCRCSENIPDDILTEILAQQVVIRNTESFVYWSCFKSGLYQLYQRQQLRHGAMLTGWPFGRLGWGRVFCQRRHHSRRRGRNRGAFLLDFQFDNFSVGPD